MLLNGKDDRFKRHVRQRATYEFWRNVISAIDDKTSIQHKSLSLLNLMDKRYMFGSHKQFEYDCTSLALALDDYEKGKKVSRRCQKK